MKFAILPACLVVVFTGSIGFSQTPKERTVATRLEGSWTLITYRNGNLKEATELPPELKQTKILADGRFVWTLVSHGKVQSGAGGRYTVEKDRYTENVDYVFGDDLSSLVGKKFDFRWSFDGEKWLHKGTIKVNDTDFAIDEVWERVKSPDR